VLTSIHNKEQGTTLAKKMSRAVFLIQKYNIMFIIYCSMYYRGQYATVRINKPITIKANVVTCIKVGRIASKSVPLFPG
jgi:hypothetical protein